MSKKTYKLSDDLRGLGKLTTDAIIGITDIVEALHQKIISLGGLLPTSEKDKTTGITGLVYRNLRSVTKIIGTGIDVLLGQLATILGEKNSSPDREAVLAALNGVLGDYLLENNNPLAISMQFRLAGKALSKPELSKIIKQSRGKLLIILHGLCMNDLQWERQGHNHAETLAQDIGITPIYLHYNTGLHVSENGKQFAKLMETLVPLLPSETELFFLTHSMGGLVARSACHFAENSKQKWLKYLKKMLFLGTPHHGALLEKGGNWIDILLQTNPYSAPFSRLGKIRSSGITDMRYGNVSEQDWQGHSRFALSGDRRISVPLPKNVACYAIAATTGNTEGTLVDTFGDGLVSVNSALGEHKNVELKLLFPEKQQWVARKISHMELLNNLEIYKKIKEFLLM